MRRAIHKSDPYLPSLAYEATQLATAEAESIDPWLARRWKGRRQYLGWRYYRSKGVNFKIS